MLASMTPRVVSISFKRASFAASTVAFAVPTTPRKPNTPPAIPPTAAPTAVPNPGIKLPIAAPAKAKPPAVAKAPVEVAAAANSRASASSCND